MVRLLEAGVGHDQPPVVQHEVRDQAVTPLRHLLPEFRSLRAELLQGLGQPVTDLHLAPLQRPDQLVLVVARDGKGVPGA